MRGKAQKTRPDCPFDEGVVGLEGRIGVDGRIECSAFEEMARAMAIALRFGTAERVIDHGAPQERRRQGMLAFEPAGGGIEDEVEIAVDLGMPIEHQPSRLSQRLPFHEEAEGSAKRLIAERMGEGLLLCFDVLEVG